MMRLTSRRSQPPLALAVPLSRFTSLVGGGSAFFVRRMSTKMALTIWLLKIAWIIFVALVAIQVAIYGYTKNGIGGFFLGLVVGIFGGAMSATIWAFLLYFIFRLGRFIFRLCKPSAGGQ